MDESGAFRGLSGVARFLEGIVGERFGESLPLPCCDFRPQPVVERGEWWSDWCLDVAKVARCDPRPLADELVAAVVGASGLVAEGMNIRASEGYVTVSCRELPAPSRVMLSRKRRIVVVAPPIEGTNRWLAMRTAAAAAVQAHLSAVSGEASEVWLGDEGRLVCDQFCSAEQLREILAWPWQGRARSVGSVRSLVERVCREARELKEEVSLWCLPATLSHTVFRRWYRSSGIDSGGFNLCCPSGGWFVDPPHHDFDLGILGRDQEAERVNERLWGLALHLAGGQSARELDQYVGWFAEFDSLPWSIRAAVERLGRSDQQVKESEWYPVINQKSRAALLSAAFQRDAVLFGAVPLLVEALRDLARDAHRIASFPPRGNEVFAEEAAIRGLVMSVCSGLNQIFG